MQALTQVANCGYREKPTCGATTEGGLRKNYCDWRETSLTLITGASDSRIMLIVANMYHPSEPKTKKNYEYYQQGGGMNFSAD